MHRDRPDLAFRLEYNRFPFNKRKAMTDIRCLKGGHRVLSGAGNGMDVKCRK